MSNGSPKVSEICAGNREMVEPDLGVDPINSVCAKAVGRESPVNKVATNTILKIRLLILISHFSFLISLFALSSLIHI